MWRCRSADVKVWRCRSADVKVWRCRSADLKVWRCRSADVKVWRCRSADVKVWRCRSADLKVWRCRSADVKVWRCRSADLKVWRCITTAAFLRIALHRRSRENNAYTEKAGPVLETSPSAKQMENSSVQCGMCFKTPVQLGSTSGHVSIERSQASFENVDNLYWSNKHQPSRSL